MKIKLCKEILDELSVNLIRLNSISHYPHSNMIIIEVFYNKDIELNYAKIEKYNFYLKEKPIVNEKNIQLNILTTKEQENKIRKEKLKKII